MTDTQHETADRVSDERLASIEAAITAHWGERCPDFSEYCPCCEVWETYDALLALRAHDAGQAGVSWDVQEYKIWKGINPDKPCWHSRGFSCPSWADANELLEFLEHNDHGLLLRVAPNPLSAFSPTRPTPSLFGDALAAAGQSIGMSVTRVHPASYHPAFAASLTRVKDQLEVRPEALRGPFKVDGLAPYVHPEPEKVGEAENPMRFFCSNVDSWGAAEWFDRLAQAIRAHDKAIVAGNNISAETHRMIASSSAMRLVRDFEPIVRAALKGDSNGQ